MKCAIVAAATVLACTVAAQADPAGIIVSQPTSPIRIDKCGGAGNGLINEGTERFVRLNVTNTTPHRATAVRLGFTFLDHFGDPLPAGDTTMDFTDGVSQGSSVLVARWYGGGVELWSNAMTERCYVVKVLFDDGSTWNAP